MAVRIELRRDAGKVDPTRERWIRRKQVARVQGPPDPMAIAQLVDHRGRVLGHGLYSPESSIVLRLLCSGEAPPPEDWLERRLSAALDARASLGLGEDTDGYRELNSEGDGLPGLVVDRFGDWRVLQITTAPMAARREQIAARLRDLHPLPGGQIILAPESAATREGFAAGVQVEPSEGDSSNGPDLLHWREHGLRFSAPAPPAQKTGAYHDQRDNRQRFAQLVADWRRPEGAQGALRMLDLGCHVGGFSVAAAARGVEVLAVDQSEAALASARRNAADNGVEFEILRADMFGALDQPALTAAPFDALIFDPPKIASSRRDLDRARKAMSRSLRRLRPYLRAPALVGLCSCSHHLGWDQLDRAVLEAGLEARRIARWGPGVDHPVSPAHLEGEYLRVAVYLCGPG